jgi:hypothetical protein
LILTSLLLPGEALWKRVVPILQSPLAGWLGPSPFLSLAYPSTLMIEYALGNLLVILILALRHFSHQDL